jgi:pyruvate dehydrogenase E2 component (dihydrolipoamide acetyltransferase)
MATIFRMPEVAANTAEAVLAAWSVAENAAFAAGDAIATVETDKAAVDIEAEADGVLLKALVPAGTSVAVGAPIAVLGTQDSTTRELEAALTLLDLPAAVAQVVREAAASPAADDVPESSPRVFASPLARRLASTAGLELAVLDGTGPGGRIIRRDVERAIADLAVVEAALASPVAVADASVGRGRTVPGASAAPSPLHVDIPHSRMRKAIATRLTESKQTIPHFYLRGTCRVDKLLKLRKRLNAEGPDRISVNDLIIKAAARTHVLVPGADVIWTAAATRSFPTVDVSVAISTGSGLVTPVVRSADQLSISAVAAQVRDFAARAENGTLRPEDLDGGTLTVTNLGMHGTEEFAAIINPPQAMILAVGAARPEPVVVDGRLKAATVMRVTLSVDHRVVDGVLAATWMRTFIGVVEHPLRALR